LIRDKHINRSVWWLTMSVDEYYSNWYPPLDDISRAWRHHQYLAVCEHTWCSSLGCSPSLYLSCLQTSLLSL